MNEENIMARRRLSQELDDIYDESILIYFSQVDKESVSLEIAPTYQPWANKKDTEFINYNYLIKKYLEDDGLFELPVKEYMEKSIKIAEIMNDEFIEYFKNNSYTYLNKVVHNEWGKILQDYPDVDHIYFDVEVSVYRNVKFETFRDEGFLKDLYDSKQ